MPPSASPREFLRKTEVFSSLGDESLALVEERLRRTSLAPGEYVCREGDPSDAMFVIAEGEVEVLRKNERGAEVPVSVLGPGEVAGTMSLFEERQTRSASLRARGPVTLWVLDRDTFTLVLDHDPAMTRSLLANLSRRLSKETYVVAKLLSGDMDNRLKVAFFDSKPYTETAFRARNAGDYALYFFEPRLGPDTASLASGFKVICAFVNDRLDGEVIDRLADLGVEMIAMRCAGYNNVDAAAAGRRGISVARVPAYSPYAIAEHAVALMMALNRKTHRANNRVREGNFSLNGLVGFDMHGRTAGVVGVGKIGECLANILAGFGMTVLGHDKFHNDELAARTGLRYVELDELLARSDVISLHMPLLPETRHMINHESILKMKDGAMLINTSRGALVDTTALVEALKRGKIGAAGLDVYEEEAEYFFEDLSDQVITDDVLARLTTFNNVLVTSHQAFLTREALENIADTTYANMREWQDGKRLGELANAVVARA